MIKTIFWDVDGTLLNFHETEKKAITICFEHFGIDQVSDEVIARYSAINRRYWERLELGELSRQEVLVGRFQEFFATEGIKNADAEAINLFYQDILGSIFFVTDDSLNLCKGLQGKVSQYVVTNGTARAQKKKMVNTGFDQVMDGIFISEEIGFEKPSKAFFDVVFESIPECDLKSCVIVGDSLTSDMRGGVNAGIQTCWYNPEHLPNNTEVTPDYEITDLHEVLDLLADETFTN